MRCPRCDQTIGTDGGMWLNHSTAPGNRQLCPMSKQHVPPAGTSEWDYEKWAYIASNLAVQVQDEDPATVWDYLTSLSGIQLQRLAMVSIAGMDITRPVSEIYGWVTQLPIARRTA